MRLEGVNITPGTSAAAKALVGKRITYLRRSDIDRSGRGYYFPRGGTVVAAKGRNIAIDDEWSWFPLSDFVEMVERA